MVKRSNNAIDSFAMVTDVFVAKGGDLKMGFDQRTRIPRQGAPPNCERTPKFDALTVGSKVPKQRCVRWRKFFLKKLMIRQQYQYGFTS